MEDQDQGDDKAMDEFNSAAVNVLDFLERVYLNLSVQAALAEYDAQQRANSLHFLKSCLEGSSSRAKATVDMSSSRIDGDFQCSSHCSSELVDDEAGIEDRKRAEEIQDLCNTIDKVLLKAQHAKEKVKSNKAGQENEYSKNGARFEKSTTSHGQNPEVPFTPMGKTTFQSTKAKLSVARSYMGKAGARDNSALRIPKKSILPKKVARAAHLHTLGHEHPSSLKKTTKKNEELSTKTFNRETNDSNDSPNPASSASFLTGKKVLDKQRLQFPAKHKEILQWFESKGISPDYDPMDLPKSEANSAKEEFLLAFKDMSNKEIQLSNEESKDVALIVEQTQHAIETLASKVSRDQMNDLLMIAPKDSLISKARDEGIFTVMEESAQSGHLGSFLTSKNCHNITRLSWLPQECWKYLDKVLSTWKSENVNSFIQSTGQKLPLEDQLEDQDLPKGINVLQNLWHVIQTTLLQCYFEEVVAPSLLPKPSFPRIGADLWQARFIFLDVDWLIPLHARKGKVTWLWLEIYNKLVVKL